MSPVKSNKQTALALGKKAIEGVDKHFAKVKTMTIAGVTHTPKDLKAALQAEVDAIQVVDASRAQLAEQVAAGRTALSKGRALRTALRTYVLGTYGTEAVAMLQDFGMSPPKPRGRASVATKAEALVKSKATREARHTMGSKKKLAISGAPASTAQAETPAPAAATTQAQTPAPVAAVASTTPAHS